jgi:hypothetical protein
MLGMHAIMAYGFYRYFVGVREQRYVSRNGSPIGAAIRDRVIGIATSTPEHSAAD